MSKKGIYRRIKMDLLISFLSLCIVYAGLVLFISSCGSGSTNTSNGTSTRDHTAIEITYYISPSGSDSNSGMSQSSPWKTFAHAITQLKPSDALVLMDGTYTKSTTGLPDINCASGGNAVNGTATQPITIIAQHERKAWLQSDGSVAAFHMSNCSYWHVEGLYGSSADLSSTNGGKQYSIFQFDYDNYLEVRRLLASHTNRYLNTHAIIFGHGSHNLLEESEVYNYHRFGIIVYYEDYPVIRRNYANSRNYADLPNCTANGGTSPYCSIDPARGDADIANYGTSTHAIFENNIAEGGGSSYGVVGTANDGTWAYHLGNIAIGNGIGFFGGYNSTVPVGWNEDFENNLAVNPSSGAGMKSNGGINWIIKNNTVIGANPSDGIQINPNSAITTQSATLTNNLAFNNTGRGIRLATNVSPCAITTQYSNTYNNGGTIFNPNGCRLLNNITTQPTGIDLGTNQCIVYIPVSSSMHGVGEDSTDIGANIIYRYETDANWQPYLDTNTKLWNQSTGQFPCGASVTGVNDDATFPNSSCINVHKRLNVGVNGCPIP